MSKENLLHLNPLKCSTTLFTLDPRQAHLQPNLLLENSLLRYDPTPTFLGITFDRTLSFLPHIKNIRAKSFPRLKALKFIASSTWGPSLESLSQLYKAFLRPVLTYSSPSWFPSTAVSNIAYLYRIHNQACRVITGCLNSTPLQLRFHESSKPPVNSTHSHQTLSFHEKSLRFHTPLTYSLLTQPKGWLKTKSAFHLFSSTRPLTVMQQENGRDPLNILCPFPPLVQQWIQGTFPLHTNISTDSS